ncbi:MAG: carboxypeptidase-like regulatory domain-containing protein [Bacteroidota bacterium]
MKQLSKLIIAFLCIACIQSCNDDDFNGTGGPLTDPQQDTEAIKDEIFRDENFGNTTTGKFIGTVTNTAGNNLENVQITIGNSVTMTDRNGLFVLNDVTVFENFAYIKAEKDGFIDGSRMVIPKTDGANSVQITLLEKKNN